MTDLLLIGTIIPSLTQTVVSWGDYYAWSMGIIAVVGVITVFASIWEVNRRARNHSQTIQEFLAASFECHEVRLKLIYSFAFFAMGTAVGVLGPSVPFYVDHTSSSVSMLAGVLAMRSMAWCALSTMSAPIIDRISRPHVFFAAALTLTGVMYIVVPFATHVPVFIGIQLLMGAGVGAVDSSGNTLMLRLCSCGEDTDVWMQLLHSLFAVGSLLGSAAVSATNAIMNPYPASFTSHAVVFIIHLLCAAALLIGPQAPPADHTPKQEPAGGALVPESDGLDLTGVAKWVVIAMLSLFLFFYVGTELSLMMWLTSMAVKVGLPSADTIGIAVAFSGAFAVGRVGSVVLSAHITPAVLLTADLAVGFLAILLFALFPYTPLFIWIMAVTCGFALASAYASGYALAARSCRMTGVVVGIVQLFTAGGEFIVSAFTGFLLDHQSLYVVGWYMVMCCTLATVGLGTLVTIGGVYRKRAEKKKQYAAVVEMGDLQMD